MSAIETQDAALAARIEVQTHTVADLDARVSQIDAAMPRQPSAVAPHRSSISSKGSARPVWRACGGAAAGSRSLVALKTERASVVAKGRQTETEAAPIRYVADLIGSDTDSERAIRWLILMMVLCCDPLAIGGFGTELIATL
jgi:hypothetical protein